MTSRPQMNKVSNSIKKFTENFIALKVLHLIFVCLSRTGVIFYSFDHSMQFWRVRKVLLKNNLNYSTNLPANGLNMNLDGLTEISPADERFILLTRIKVHFLIPRSPPILWQYIS